MRKNSSLLIEDGRSYFKKILFFAIPLMLTGVLQTFYNAADLVVVGRFEGELAVAAVGSTGSLVNLILGLFMGLSVGAGVCVAHSIGAKQEKDVSAILHTSVLIALILGAIVGVIGFLLAPELLKLMDTPENVIEMSSLYVRIIFIGAPASILYNYCAAMLRASGDSKRPLLFLTVAGFINVILNLILVTVFDFGVAGVGIATITSQFISASLAINYMRKTDGLLRFSFCKLRIHKDKMKKILAIGIPSGVQGTLFSLSNVLIQSSINSFGSTVVAGNSASANSEGFFYVIYHAFYDCALTFVGQSAGAKKFRDIKKIVIATMLNVLACAVILTTLGLVFKSFILSLYLPDNPEALSAATRRFVMIIPLYFLCGCMDVASGALKGLKRSLTAAIICVIFACLLRIVWVSTVFKVVQTPQSVYITYPLSWALTATFLLIFVVRTVKKEIVKQESIDDTVN